MALFLEYYKLSQMFLKVGPLLFIIYINDLPSCSYSSSCLQMIVSVLNLSPALLIVCFYKLDDLSALSLWSQNWCLPFNTNKCKLMQFAYNTSKILNYQYLIDNAPIDSITNYRDLGVYFSSDLSWSHITLSIYICLLFTLL